MKQALLFALSFLVVSVVLTWLWLSGGNVLYAKTLMPIAREIYGIVGLDGIGTMRRARFINLVPFIALMVVTPGLAIRRRLGGLVVGILVLAISHIALNGYAISMQRRGSLPLVAAIGSDAMPFMLWFVIARDFVQKTLYRVGPRADPSPDE